MILNQVLSLVSLLASLLGLSPITVKSGEKLEYEAMFGITYIISVAINFLLLNFDLWCCLFVSE